MKRLFIWLILIIGLVVGLILALPFLFSSDKIWAQVNPVLEQQIGRKISVSGKRQLSLFPNIALVLGKVEIGSQNSNDKPLASLNEMRISVDLMSLFDGSVNINELTFDGADLHLTIDEAGVANWQNAGATTDTENANTHSSFDLSKLSIKNFKITNSRLTYEDLSSASQELIEDINLDIGLENTNKTISLNGQITWQKQPLNLNLASFELDNFLNGKDAMLDFELKATPLDLTAIGQVNNGEKLGFDGHLSMTSSSMKQLGNWLKADLGAINDSGLNLATNLNFSGSTYQFGNFNLAVFGSQINGDLNVGLANAPNIYGKLAIDKVDYSKIIPPSEGSASSNSWSTAPLNVGILSQMNSNVELSIAEFKYDNILMSNLETVLTIRKSTAKIPLSMAVFGGQISANISAQAAGKGVSLALTAKAQNIKAGDALKDLEITDKLTAASDFSANVKTSGASMAQLMSNLAGDGVLSMGEGVIKGIAIADALAPELANIDMSLNSPEKLAEFALEAGKNIFTQNVSNAISDGFGQNTGDDKQTKFVKAVMNFTLNKGVLDNQDLEATSQNIIIRGAGQVDIGQKTLNYRIVPNLLRKTDDGTAERMTIPAIITGSWSDPNIAIDYAYAIENNNALGKMREKAVTNITEQITEKVTDKIVETITEKIGEEIGGQLGDAITEQIGDQVGNLLGIKPKTEDVPLATEPVAEAVEPVSEQPLPETTEPVVEIIELAPEAVEPVAEVTEPMPEAVEPVVEVTEPAPKAAEPVAEATEPTPETVEPVVEVTEPAPEAAEPVAEALPEANEQQPEAEQTPGALPETDAEAEPTETTDIEKLGDAANLLNNLLKPTE